MMKRLISAVLVFCILLCGCGVIHENNAEGRPIPVSTLNISGDQYTGRVEKQAVYFLNNTSGTLTADVRTISIAQDINPARAAVQELLRGPSKSELQSVAPSGMTLDYIEFSRSVANVYLLYNGAAMEPKQKYILEQAIANTVTDVLGASNISVFYNGKQSPYYPGIPYGTLQKQTGSIEDAWTQVSGKYADTPAVPGEDTLLPAEPAVTPAPSATVPGLETSNPPAPKVKSIPSVLYYISSDGNYLLPEVHDVKYTEGDYIRSLVNELVKGPQNTSVMKSPVVEGLELAQDPELSVESDGTYRLTLDFNIEPSKNAADLKGTLLTYASIVYTITGFIPDISGVEIYANGSRVGTSGSDKEAALQRSDFKGYIGISAPIYFADKESDLLLQVSRSMEQGKVWSARERVLELIKGPLPGEGNSASRVIPEGITDKDLLSVDVYSDTAYVNLSENFVKACAGITAKNEMLLVYAIVNTITAMDGISKVQFLVDGQQADTLAGSICLTDAFLKNYGIIKESS